MRLRRKRKPNYEHIAQLERELGLGYAPEDELGREIDEARMTALASRRKPDSGPVLLDKKFAPISYLAPVSYPKHETYEDALYAAQMALMPGVATRRAAEQELFFGPRAVWKVSDPDDIRPYHANHVTAYCASAAPMPKPVVSRVVLPAGVKA